TGDLPRAVAEARRALLLDGGFAPAHLTLGDALLATGAFPGARAEYDKLLSARSDGEPNLQHEAAMRSARSWLFDEKYLEGERERKAGRRLPAAQAFLEAARSQLERGALTEAGRGLAEARRSLTDAGEQGAQRQLGPDETRLLAELDALRALALAGLREGNL